MSVINQMLRDLDKQKRGEAIVSSRITHSPMAKRSKLWLLIVVLLVVIIAQQLWLPEITPPEAAMPADKAQLENQVLASQKEALTPVSDNAMSQLTTAKSKAITDATASVVEEPQVVAQSVKLTATDTTVSDRAEHDTTLIDPLVSTAKPVIGADEAHSTQSPSTSGQRAETTITPSQSDVMSAEIATTTTVESANSVENTKELAMPLAQQTEKPVGAAQVQRVSPEQQQLLWQQQAEQALAEGRYDEAEQLLRQWRLVEPHQALPLLAELFWQRQQSLQLDAVLTESRDLGVVDLRLERLNLYRLQQQQRWSELLTLINDQLLTSYGAEVVALKAQALWQTQQYQPALLAYQQWTSLAPTEARAWLGQALVLEQLAQPQQAQVAYQQALLHGGLSPASLQFIQQRLVALPE